MGRLSGLTVSQLIADVIQREGGFVDNPHDKGGPTNFGITRATLAGWRHRAVTVDEVRHLTQSEAVTIYKTVYYIKSNICLLPDLVQPIVFDMSVNMGVVAGVKVLQAVVSKLGLATVQDGRISGKTIQSCLVACNVHGQDVVNELVKARCAFYQDLVANDPEQHVFLSGWLNRARYFLA